MGGGSGPLSFNLWPLGGIALRQHPEPSLWWEDIRRSEDVYETGLETVHIVVVILRWY